MAQRQHRFHHYLWHRVRNAWLRLSEEERQAVRSINPGWEPPHPARDASGRPIRDNDSGEDFLFMHRQMIAHVNATLAQVGDLGYPRVEGWRRVPPPGDADYPVPDFPGSGLEEVKSPEYFEQYIAPWERRYADPDHLRSVTLGQLGCDIEFNIHNDMHMRWAAPSPVGYRPPTAVTGEIDGQWDAPAYDYLGDTYSSHVNPVFWKLHGWVDDRIEDWKRANGVAGDIDWRGAWVGPATHPHHETPHARAGARATRTPAAVAAAPDELQQIDRIISASAVSDTDGFFHPVPRPRIAPLRDKLLSPRSGRRR
jgi:hypothetical protein